jgi:hypothetical protein
MVNLTGTQNPAGIGHGYKILHVTYVLANEYLLYPNFCHPYTQYCFTIDIECYFVPSVG